MTQSKIILCGISSALLSACGGGGSNLESDTKAFVEKAEAYSFAILDPAVDGDVEISTSVPTTGSASYDGFLSVRTYRETEASTEVGVLDSGGEGAYAPMTMIANFEDSRVTGSATDFLGATNAPRLHRITDETTGEVLQNRSDVDLTNARKYTGTIEFEGDIDRSSATEPFVSGQFSGRLESDHDFWDLNSGGVGVFLGDANEDLLITNGGVANGSDPGSGEKIGITFVGSR